jgi:TRAP-type transport system periplasmic protein
VLRTHYRFQIQGPDAPKIFEKMNGGPIPDIKFFHVDWINVGSKKVQALRHGMSGAPGARDLGALRGQGLHPLGTILQAARDAGVTLVQCGSRAYSTNTLESGWIPSPLPGIYTGEGMLQDYRDWLGSDMYEAAGAIGGSFVSDNIEDYYVNPFELGYGFYIGWKKGDFIGQGGAREAQGRADEPQEGDLRVEPRGRGQGHRLGLRGGHPLQVDRLPAAELRLVHRRHGDARRPDGRHVDVQRLQLQRTPRAVAGRGAPGHPGRRRADPQVGRAGTDRQDLDRTRTARPRSASACRPRPMPPRHARTTPTAGGRRPSPRNDEQYVRVVQGVADMAWGLPGYTSSQFPKSMIVEMPNAVPLDTPGYEALWRAYDSFASEYPGVKPLAIWTSEPNIFIMKDREIRTPADLQGLKIRVAGSTMADVATALGATPVQMPIGEVYNALQTGLIDGVITGASTLSDFKLDEVANSYTLGANIGRGSFFAVMNQGAYDALPDDQKAAIDAVAGVPLSKSAEDAWNATADAALDAARAAGNNTVIDLTPEEAQVFADAVAAVTNAYVESVGGTDTLAAMRGE